jgi:hypothetical protein
MKTFIALLLVALAGCAGQKSHQSTHPAATTNTVAVTIAPSLAGAGVKITHVDAKLKFVVLDFTGQLIPAPLTTLNVFRAGQKVGQVQINGPAKPPRATADILSGDLRVGDEAR